MAISDLDIARGTASGKESGILYGFTKDIQADWSDVWPASSIISWQTAATLVSVSSTHAADAAAGDGCRSVRITGLDSAGAEQTEVIATNGVTAVPSVLTYLRVNSFEVVDVGTYGATHQGNITCRVKGAPPQDIFSLMTGKDPGVVNDNVNYGSGVAGNGFFSVPAGKAMYITGGRLVGRYNQGSVDALHVSLMHRPEILNVTAPFRAAQEIWSTNGQSIKSSGDVFDFSSSPLRIEPLSDFWVRAATSSNTNAELNVIINYYLTTA